MSGHGEQRLRNAQGRLLGTGDGRMLMYSGAEIMEAVSPPSDWGPWQLDASTCVLYTDQPYHYEIDLEQCLTSAHVLDRVMQIAGKDWPGSDQILAGMLRALNDVLHPQASLCSWGKPRRDHRGQGAAAGAAGQGQPGPVDSRLRPGQRTRELAGSGCTPLAGSPADQRRRSVCNGQPLPGLHPAARAGRGADDDRAARQHGGRRGRTGPDQPAVLRWRLHPQSRAARPVRGRCWLLRTASTGTGRIYQNVTPAPLVTQATQGIRFNLWQLNR